MSNVFSKNKRVHTIQLNQYGIQLYESKHNAGDTIEEHSHKIHQFLYVIDGHGMITLDGSGQELIQDHLVCIVPFSNHEVISNDHLTLLVLGIDTSLMESRLPQNFMSERFSKSFAIKLNPFHSSDIRALLRKMLFEQASKDELSEFALTIYVQEFLYILTKAQSTIHIQDANSIRAEKIKSYIDSFYYELLTSHDIAAKLGISARYVNSIFKEQFKVTPLQYLNQVRISIAQKMLAETEKEIVSICFEVGYDSLSTFYRAFKNSTQLSPNKYRQSISDSENVFY